MCDIKPHCEIQSQLQEKVILKIAVTRDKVALWEIKLQLQKYKLKLWEKVTKHN